MTLSYWSWTRACVTVYLGWTCCSWNRSFVTIVTIVRLKCFFILVMDCLLGPSDSSMMGIKVLGNLFFFMAVGTFVAKVTILGGELETR